MLTILGWFRAEADFASRTKRSAELALGTQSPRKTLMATTRFRRLSRALYTSPMPPAPSGVRISYGPSFVPPVNAIRERNYRPCSAAHPTDLTILGSLSGYPGSCPDFETIRLQMNDPTRGGEAANMPHQRKSNRSNAKTI